MIPHVVRRITTTGGKTLYERSGDGPGAVVDPAYVAMMNGMLRATLEQGTGKRAAIAGWPAAGKTGTSQDFRDAWFVGYTATLVAGAWFGNDNARPTKKASGSNLPAIAWQRFMTTALDGIAVAALPGAPSGREPPASIATIIGEDGQPLTVAPRPVAGTSLGSGDPDWQDAPPIAPVAITAPGGSPGGLPAGQAPPRRKGFLERLFGR